MMDESTDFQPALDTPQSAPLFDNVDINGGSDRRINGSLGDGSLAHGQDNEIFESAVQVWK